MQGDFSLIGSVNNNWYGNFFHPEKYISFSFNFETIIVNFFRELETCFSTLFAARFITSLRLFLIQLSDRQLIPGDI